MKRKFISVSVMKKLYFKDRNGERNCFKTWECFEVWLITKEENNSRCIDFKRLIMSRNKARDALS